MNASQLHLPPRVIQRAAEIQREVSRLRASGRTIGFVPTMGALHEGHLSLVRQARRECDATVVSIFVNPSQFGPREDFQQYPRTWAADLEKLGQQRVELVFAPPAGEMYPQGYSTWIDPPRVAEPLEGRCRAGHFRGVATVVLKLLNLVPADAAYFGQKDYQQALVVRRLVDDLHLPVRIVVGPTVREADGLAMSSRNQYLDSEQRQRSLGLWRSLQAAREMVEQGERDARRVADRMRGVLEDAGLEPIDYAVLADPESLEELASPLRLPAVALVAAYAGSTRLIDNLLLDRPSPSTSDARTAADDQTQGTTSA